MILAADVGATKILMEAGDFRSGRWAPHLAERYEIANFGTFGDVVETFLARWQAVKPARARITAAGIGVAGPAINNKVKMTHRPWTIDGGFIARRFGIPKVRVVNDLAAAAYGVGLIGPKDLLTVQAGKAVAGAPQAVIGIGTGLGVAYLVPSGNRIEVVPGEGGHVGFSPASPAQLRLSNAMMESRGRVEAEEVVSGRGLSNIYEFLCHEHADAAWISEGAMTRGDPTCRAALELLVECLGNIAGDHALASMARGGVFIVGGVAAKIAPLIKSPQFVAAFCAKGAFSGMVMKIPVKVVTTERVAIFGAARFAL